MAGFARALSHYSRLLALIVFFNLRQLVNHFFMKPLSPGEQFPLGHVDAGAKPLDAAVKELYQRYPTSE